MMFSCGVDPGLSGCAAILDANGALLTLIDMPTVAQGGFVRRRVDPVALSQRLRAALPQPDATIAAIEAVGHRKGDGAVSGASLAASMAVVEGILAALGVSRILRPPPMIWKRAMGLLTAGKSGAVARAVSLWPELKGKRHDVCEAALLARFAFLNRAAPYADVSERASAQEGRSSKARARSKSKPSDNDLGAWPAPD